MTLNITVITPWGVWQSADNRVADKQGKLLDDYSIKNVGIRCPDGAVLMTYAGYGNVPGTKTAVSRWIREYIRGETRGLNQTLIAIREGATKWLNATHVKDRIHHFFVAGGYLGGNPWAVIISNAEPRKDWLSLPPKGEFLTTAKKVQGESVVLVTGVGMRALGSEDFALLNRCAQRKPRKPEDYHDLLADVNQKASKHQKYRKFISERCITVYMPPPGEPISAKLHGWRGDKIPVVPVVLMGIDTAEIMEQSSDLLRRAKEGGPDSEETRRRIDEAGKRSVETKHGQSD